MLNKTTRSTIIVMTQCIVPAMLLFIIAPQFINHTHQFNQSRAFFNTYQLHFLLIHICFYLTLLGLWPWLIKLSIRRLNGTPDTNQIKTAISARWYLITAMAFFELLAWWK